MKILICSPIDSAAIDELRSSHEVDCLFHASTAKLQAGIRDCEVLVFRSGVQINRDVLSRASRLQLLIRAGSGIDNLDTGYAEKRGLHLVRIQDPGARAVAEMAFGLMLVLARDLVRIDRSVRQGLWPKDESAGHLLRHKTLGIVGCGNIGSLVGKLGSLWEMNPVGCVQHRSETVERKLKRRGIRLLDLDEVMATSDFVSLHVPLTDATRHLIGARELALMKPGSFLINLARGGVVDETALLQELRDGRRVRGAALDVQEKEGPGVKSPFAELPNVILTPHIGAMTIESQREIGHRTIEIIDAWAKDPRSVRVKTRDGGTRAEGE